MNRYTLPEHPAQTVSTQLGNIVVACASPLRTRSLLKPEDKWIVNGNPRLFSFRTHLGVAKPQPHGDKVTSTQHLEAPGTINPG